MKTPDEWPLGAPEPIDYVVVDDQYNHEWHVCGVALRRRYTLEGIGRVS